MSNFLEIEIRLMMRSASWITLLLALFMFQSLWNVAAAFCVHEESSAVIQQYHFGHHTNALCVSETKEHSHAVSDTNVLTLGDDHQDHLPSMTHLILEQPQSVPAQTLFSYAVVPKYLWRNDYRSPDLIAKSPPPEFSPLMVG